MDELETLLRQFRPRRPGPLPDVGAERGSRRLVRVMLASIAAAVAIVVGWRQPTHDSDGPKAAVTLGALTPYAINEASDLDSLLTSTSRAILPDVERSNGVLHALAKE